MATITIPDPTPLVDLVNAAGPTAGTTAAVLAGAYGLVRLNRRRPDLKAKAAAKLRSPAAAVITLLALAGGWGLHHARVTEWATTEERISEDGKLTPGQAFETYKAHGDLTGGLVGMILLSLTAGLSSSRRLYREWAPDLFTGASTTSQPTPDRSGRPDWFGLTIPEIVATKGPNTAVMSIQTRENVRQALVESKLVTSSDVADGMSYKRHNFVQVSAYTTCLPAAYQLVDLLEAAGVGTYNMLNSGRVDFAIDADSAPELITVLRNAKGIGA